MSPNMDEEIRENAGDALNEATADTVGTKKWGEQEPNTGGVADPQVDESQQAAAASGGGTADTAGIIDAAEKAKAAFAGTADLPGAAGVVESEADDAPAGGESADSDSSDMSAHNADGKADDLGEVSGDFDAEDAAEHADKEGKDDSDEDKQPGTGAMMAGILASDPNMKLESKIVAAFSDTDSTEDTTK